MASRHFDGTFRIQPLFTAESASKNLEKLDRIKLKFSGFYRAVSKQEWDTQGEAQSDPDFYHHIHFARGGTASVYHEQSDTRIDIQPGRAYWFPAGVPLVRTCDHYYASYFLLLRCELIEGVDLFSGWPNARPMELGLWERQEWSADWERLPLSLNAHIRLQGQLFKWLAQSFPDLDEIIAHHLRMFGQYAPIFEHIEKHLGAELRVKELADIQSTSLHAFSMAFTRDLGISPKVYLNRRLNREACSLVTNTNCSVKIIATKLGFSDEYYFSRFFSKMNGMPPIRYRQQFLAKRHQSPIASEAGG